MVHTQQTIEAVCLLRKDGLSCEKIAKQLNLTKNQVLALVYKHYLKIDRHKVYRDRSNSRATSLADRETRPSVPFVKGLSDTKYYVTTGRKG